MSIQFANSTSFPVFPLVASGLDLNTTAVAQEFSAVKLRDLSRLGYLKARIRGQMIASAASATGVITFNLQKNGTTIDTAVLNMNAVDTDYDFDLEVVLDGVGGDDDLTVEFEVTTAAGAGITATCSLTLDIDHPVVYAV